MISYSPFLFALLTTICCNSVFMHAKNEAITNLVKEIVALDAKERHEIYYLTDYALTSYNSLPTEKYRDLSINPSTKIALLACHIVSLVCSFAKIKELGNALAVAQNRVDLADEMWEDLARRGICCKQRALMTVIGTLIDNSCLNAR